jgi:hypothetical protein
MADSGMRRWGFQLTVMDTSNLAGGTITVTDPAHMYLHDNPGANPDYLNQNYAGTYNGQLHGPVSWTFDWTAPETDVGPITFYASTTPCDGNGSAHGDLSVETQMTSHPSSISEEGTIVREPGDLSLAASMDPGTDLLRISFSFGGAGSANISFVLCDTSGREVSELRVGSLDPGAHERTWQALTDMPAGMYFVAMEVNGARELSQKIFLVK